MKSLLLTLIVLSVSVTAYTQEIKREYDKFKDKTSVSMKFKLNKTMKVELKTSYPGQTPKEAGPVVFVMEISTLYASYQADHDLIFLADESRVTGSGGAYFSMRDGVVGQKEIISHIFRAENFKEILDAKKLEVRWSRKAGHKTLPYQPPFVLFEFSFIFHRAFVIEA